LSEQNEKGIYADKTCGSLKFFFLSRQNCGDEIVRRY
jgi:hypothetical protein